MLKQINLVIIFVIFQSLSFSNSLLNINHLVKYKDKYYRKNNTQPFTGIVFKLSKNTWSKIMEAKIINGEMHGSYYEWYDFNKRKKKGNYKNGIRNGLFLSWHYNGNQSSEVNYVDGKAKGVSYFWNEIGMKTRETNNETGISKVWDYYDNKNILSISIEHVGRLHGKFTNWYIDGKIMIEGFYDFGKKNGLWITYKKNGKKNTEGLYKDDKKDGLWVTYDNNEMNKIEEIYKNGLLIDVKEYRYYLSGEKFVDITYEKDNSIRRITTYTIDGSKLGESKYKSGKLIGITEKWTDSLRIEYTLNFSNDYLEGDGIYWYENGIKSSEGKFSDGKKISNWNYYDRDGNLIKEQSF